MNPPSTNGNEDSRSTCDSTPTGVPSSIHATNNNNNPHALDMAQDGEEVFEVMKAPPFHFNIYQDRPVSTMQRKYRKLVHRDNDWHRSVHVWLVDAKNKKIVLQKRPPNKDTFPNRWDISAAGHIGAEEYSHENANDNHANDNHGNPTHTKYRCHSDESCRTSYSHGSKQTAISELAEELGIVATAEDLIFAYTCPAEQAPLGGCNAYEDVYFLTTDSQTCKFAIGKAEVTQVKWMDIELLEKILTTCTKSLLSSSSSCGADSDTTDNRELYVPRVERYTEAFFKHLRGLCDAAAASGA